MKTTITKTLLSGLFILLLSGSAFAQQMQMPPAQPEPLDSVTTEQFNTFVDINKQFQAVQQNTQQQIADILEEQPMTMQRFQEIVTAMQNPQNAGQLNMTNEEQQTLTAIQPQLMQVSQAAQQEQVKIIEDNGLTTQMFQRIGMTISQDQNLMQRFQSEMMAGTEEGSDQ